MFNKLKHLKELRSQAKELQATLAQEKVTNEKKGVSITMNGNLEIEQLSIDESLSKADVEKTVQSLVNDTIKKAQRVMATKMQSMGGFNFPGMGKQE